MKDWKKLILRKKVRINWEKIDIKSDKKKNKGKNNDLGILKIYF